jgi:2-haloalkanoic acid dehalogenase type II
MKQAAPKPKAIIFDCWNTLFYVDSRQSNWTAISKKILHHSLSYPLMKTIEHELMTERQDDLRPAIKRLLSKNHIPPVDPIVARVQRALDGALLHQTAFPESLEVLRELKKTHKLGLLSNTHYQSFSHLSEAFKLEQYFDIILPSYEAGRIKPDPEIFLIVLDKLGVMPEEAVMVGDNLRDDILAAEAVGMRGILIDRTSERDKHPERVRDLRELEVLL